MNDPTLTLECGALKKILLVVLRNVGTIEIRDMESKSIVEDLNVDLKAKVEKANYTATSSVSTLVFLL
jgi:hypothetical protein